MQVTLSTKISKHLVSLTGRRYWPVLLSFSILNLLFRNLIFWKLNHFILLTLTILYLLLITFLWSKDLGNEATLKGQHSLLTQSNLKTGIAFFIFREVILFFSFFWTYLHFSLNPIADLGLVWPSQGVYSLDPLSVPLLNTLILVSSGLTLTVRHHFMLNNNLLRLQWLLITVLLGLIFTLFQVFEYQSASYTWSSSTYGSTFFIITGFHGGHVIVGTLLLTISLIKITIFKFNPWHHVLFELSAWYWHFVDVVWLFLYIIVYWWSN